MKKHPRIQNKQLRTARNRVPQAYSRSNFYWIFIAAICFVVFICTVGMASAAQNSGGSLALTQKEQRIQQIVKAGRAHLHPKLIGQNQMPPVQPAPARQAGITSMRQGPFPHSLFAVQDLWQGPVGKDWVLAYAGAKMNVDGTTGQGGIVLYTETIDNLGSFDLHPLGTFLAPPGTTGLTITASRGDQLLLSSTTGQHLTFNLTTHRF
jgi:hypothetical protein